MASSDVYEIAYGRNCQEQGFVTGLFAVIYE